jgi:hypothetical protein
VEKLKVAKEEDQEGKKEDRIDATIEEVETEEMTGAVVVVSVVEVVVNFCGEHY